MKPTPTQALAHTTLCEWLNTNETKPLIIGGGAGTGKTYSLMNLLIPALIQSSRSFVLTATTHQANDMLLANLIKSPTNALIDSPITLHSMLGLQPTTRTQLRNPKGFELCGYKLRITQPDKYNHSILVIDEAFRIDRNLYEILKYLLPNVRLILIGDPFQVPPVGEQQSYVEELDCVRVTLEEAPRFINGGILGSVVTSLRLAVANKTNDYWSILPKNDPNISEVKKSAVRARVNALVDSGEPILDSDVVILCGTKKAEFSHNNYILNRREQAGHSLFNYGEAYTVDTVIESSFEDQTDAVGALRKERQFGKTLMTAIWTDCKYGIYSKIDPTTVVILLTPWATSTVNDDFMKLVANCRRKSHDIVFLRLNIARTIHLAQGLTSHLALMDRDSINKWANHNMRRRLIYTGVSRAANTLHYF